MKSSLIVLLVVSFSLIGSFSNSYAETITFVSSFDGSDGGTLFQFPFGVTVDSNNRIIVTDLGSDSVQIFESDETFVTSFDGRFGAGTQFMNPTEIIVDNNDNIIVSDNTLDLVQIFDSNGMFLTSFDGSEGDGTAFQNPAGLAVDSNHRIIVVDTTIDVVQIYNSDGTFLTSFDGSEGDGTAFDSPSGVTVDNNDRIIVSDTGSVQIYNSDETFVTSFNGTYGGGTAFEAPSAVAVNSNNNRIIVSDVSIDMVQIFESDGTFITAFDGMAFVSPFGVAVDNNDRIIVTDAGPDIVLIFEGFTDAEDLSVELSDPTGPTTGEGSDDLNGGCADCTPPTLGLGFFDRERIVDNGFSYNGNSVQVEKWHTPFPLITAQVGQLNTVEIIVYENQGIHNMKLVQFGLGATEIGQPLNDLEVLIEVWLDTFSSDHEIGIEKIIIKDRDNLIETFTVFAVVDIVKCADNSLDDVCLKVTLEYSYREATINNILVVNVADISRNSQNFYFNDGVQVIGESLNEPPTYTLHNKTLKQQTENLYLTLTRTDKVNHIWTDESGVEYLQISDDRFDRITPHTPMECTDPPLDEINVPTRNNCHFRELL